MLCPACKKSMKKIGDIPFRDFDESIFNFIGELYGCTFCGLVHVQSSFSDLDISNHYANNCLYHAMSGVGVGGMSDEDIARYRLYKQLIERYIYEKGELVDIGCSRGGLLLYLQYSFQNKGIRLIGIDPDQSSIQEIQNNNGLNAILGNAFCLPFPDGSRKVISYFHVLEHIKDIDLMLSEASRILSENGIAIFEVPDAAGYQREGSVGSMFWMGMKEHINHFTCESIYMALKRHGLNIITYHKSLLPMKNCNFYPSLIVIAKKMVVVDHLDNQYSLDKSIVINNYINEMASFRLIIIKISKFINKYDSISFWGIGLEFFNLYAHIASLLINKTLHFIDSNTSKQKLLIDNIQIISPSKYRVSGGLIICSYMSNDEIYKSAVDVGWKSENIYILK